MNSLNELIAVSLFWLFCRDAGVMTGCQSHTLGSALGRILVVGAAFGVCVLLWRRLSMRRKP